MDARKQNEKCARMHGGSAKVLPWNYRQFLEGYKQTLKFKYCNVGWEGLSKQLSKPFSTVQWATQWTKEFLRCLHKSYNFKAIFHIDMIKIGKVYKEEVIENKIIFLMILELV